MAQEWFVVRSDRDQGPLTGRQLKQLAASGQIQPNDLVKLGNTGAPRLAGTIKGLFQTQGVVPVLEEVISVFEEVLPVEEIPQQKSSTKLLLILGGSAVGLLFVFCCGGLGIMAVIRSKMEKQARAEFVEADRLWESGDKAAGAGKYRSIIDDGRLTFLKEEDRARLYGRLIDYEYEQGHADAGKKLIDEADRKGVTPVVSHAKAKAVIVAMQQEKRRIEAERAEKKRIEAEKAEKMAARKKSKYTRDEFKNLVVNQTKQDLLNLLGKPSETQELGDMEFWYYRGITFNPVTDKKDFFAQIVIQGGIVTSVNFN